MNRHDTARSQILERLQATRRAESTPRPAEAALTPVPNDDRLGIGRSLRFCVQIEALGGVCEVHEDAVNARLALLLRLREAECTHLITNDTNLPTLPGLSDALRDSGVLITAPQDVAPHSDTMVGLAVADAGLERTGSLIFSRREPRAWLPVLTSLRFYVLVRRSQLYETLEQWRVASTSAGRGATAGRALIMTGRSVSGDVELHLHYGVYGPRFMHVFVIRG